MAEENLADVMEVRFILEERLKVSDQTTDFEYMYLNRLGANKRWNSYCQDVAAVHGSVRYNHILRKCVDIILTKVRNISLFVYLIKFNAIVHQCIQSFYSFSEHHLSFQCPPEYREDIERNERSPNGEQSVPPTKRSLSNLHYKVKHFEI